MFWFIFVKFIEGNKIELEAAEVKDENGKDFATKKMQNIVVSKSSNIEPAFGKEFQARIKEKLRKNVRNDAEVNLFHRVNALAQTRQMHGIRQTDKDGQYKGRICTATCMKGRRLLLKGKCRFSFGEKGKELVMDSHIDKEGNIILCRNNSHIVTYSPAILAVVGSNICLDIIKTGRDGTAMDMYLTNYSTKNELTTGKMFSILASDKSEAPDYADDNNLNSFKK